MSDTHTKMYIRKITSTTECYPTKDGFVPKAFVDNAREARVAVGTVLWNGQGVELTKRQRKVLVQAMSLLESLSAEEIMVDPF